MSVLTSLRCVAVALVIMSVFGLHVWAADEGSITGTIVDPLGGRVQGKVTLLRGGQSVAETTSDGRGEFTVQTVASGRYQLQVEAPGMASRTTDPVFVGPSGKVSIEVPLQIGPLQQEVSVTAAASEVLPSRTGAPVTIIANSLLVNLAKVDVLEAIRTVPGSQIVQTGGRGGTTSLFIRGGASDFNKVLLDGIPGNDMGGTFDFGALSTTGVDSVEVLRGSNSVLYGSDAMTGVVSVTTPRGRAPQPELNYTIDGGNFDTIRQAASIGGVKQRMDYFFDFAHFKTDNDLPNNGYQNGTFASRIGYALGSRTDLNVTVRRTRSSFQSPNGFSFFGTPDDTFNINRYTFVIASAQSQWTEKWRSVIRAGSTVHKFNFLNPTLSGDMVDGFGVGKVVTLRGANGFSTTGRAILDFGPSTFNSRTNRWTLYGQTDYRIVDGLDIAGGVRVESEFGTSNLTRANRNNSGYFVEARTDLWRRVHVNGGVGFEDNAVFGFAATPRVSAAVYLRNPSATGRVSDTKVVFNFGKGIKEPSLFDQLSSLHTLLRRLPNGSALIDRFHVEPIDAPRNRSIDGGIEQGFWGGRARIRALYFHNDFKNLIEFVSRNVLPQLGVPVEVATASGFGATVNSSSYHANGVEISAVSQATRMLRVSGSYTYLDAVVTKSFSGSALAPSFNPNIPGVPIGAFSPLVGARPLRRPPHTGNFVLTYTPGRATVSLAGYFVSKADDSTFLSDVNFGNTMLLPNKDLNFGYQKIDLSGSYRFNAHFKWFASIENLFDKKDEAAFGFPALPFAFRSGVTVTVGESR